MRQNRLEILYRFLLIVLGFLISLFLFYEPSTTAINESYTLYGVHIHNTWIDEQDTQQILVATSINAEVVRIGVSWWLLEPTPDDWDTTWYIPALTERISSLRAEGIKPMLMLGHVPCWASAEQPPPDCSEPTQPNHDLWCPPANAGNYANALAYLMNEFGDDVQLWEIWNEPNISSFWCNQPPDAQAYTNLLQTAYTRAKSIDASSIVLGGALAGTDSDYLLEMYLANANEYYDALSVHPYNGHNTPPSSCPDWPNTRWEFECGIDAIRDTMIAHNDMKPIWLTEFGWCIMEGNDCVSNESLQADFLEEALSIIDSWDFIAGAIWYSLVDCSLPNSFCDGDYGLYEGNMFPKLVAETFRIEVGLRQEERLRYKILLPVLVE